MNPLWSSPEGQVPSYADFQSGFAQIDGEFYAGREAACRIIDHGWDKKRFQAVEKEAMASFDIVPPRVASTVAADGYGRSVVPVSQPKPVATKETENVTQQSGGTAASWSIRD